MAEVEMERLIHRLDELEKRSTQEISDLRAKNVAAERKLGELEEQLVQQSSFQEERTSLISADADRSNANRSAMWHAIGDKLEMGAATDAFKQPEFTLPNDLCSVFCATSWKHLPFWISILIIVGFQFSLFIFLLIDRVGQNSWTGLAADCDEEDSKACRFDRPLDIPANVEPMVRAAQVLSLVIALYDHENIRDGVEGFVAGIPADYKGSSYFRGMTVARWNFSCFIRFLQGLLGLVCAFVLLVQSNTVFDVLLNFLGVKFISDMDIVAFDIALKGYFGSDMQKAAEDVAESYFRRLEDSRPWLRRNFHVIVMMGLLVLMTSWFTHLAVLQSSGTFLIHNLQVQFEDDPFLSMFDGCYSASHDGSRLSYSTPGSDAKFGYCRRVDKNDNGGWTLYFGNSPCPEDNGDNLVLAVSGPTRSFDLPQVDRTKWYEPQTRTRVGSVRFDDVYGSCPNNTFAPQPNFGAQCLAFNSTGKDGQKYFEMLVERPSAEYPCRDPTTCNPIYVSYSMYWYDVDVIFFTGQNWVYVFAMNLLDTYIEEDFESHIINYFYNETGFKFETHLTKHSKAEFVSKPTDEHGILTPLDVKWYHAKDKFISYRPTSEGKGRLSYSIPYPDLEKPVDLKLECFGNYTPLCFEDGEFVNLDPQCMCSEPIPNGFDLATPQGKALQEFRTDRQSQKLCVNISSVTADGFHASNLIYERFALAVIKHTFGIESQHWDDNNRTSWLGDSVQLDFTKYNSVQRIIFLNSDTVQNPGSIPIEIMYFQNLEHLDMGQNDVTGQIPGDFFWFLELTHLDLFDCKLTGTIPWEIGSQFELEKLYLGDNQLTGSIPEYIFGELTKLTLLSVPNNQLTGTIPPEIEANKNLTCFAEGNLISGTSEVCQL